MSDSSVVVLSRFQADISRALARRAERLLESSNAKDRVAALAPLEAYFVIKELGVADATPLLRHVSSEQLQAFVDLDCWQGDEPSFDDLDAWLAPFAAQGAAALAEAFSKLDEELQVLTLGDSLIIHALREVEDLPDPPKGAERMTTPDSFFAVDTIAGQEREVHPHLLVKALYAHDLHEAFRLLTAARWELASPLREEALRFRTGRLEELGFVTRQEAMNIFAPPPKAPGPGLTHGIATETTLPAIVAAPLNDETLLTRAMALVTDGELLSRVEASLMYLVNTAVVAYASSPQNVRTVTEVARRVRNTMGLGLETLLSPDRPHPFINGADAARDAAALLSRWTPSELFRFGHHEVVHLQRSAVALLEDPVIAQWLERTESERDDYSQDRFDRAFLRALVANPPLKAGWDVQKPDTATAFGTKAELEEAAQRVDAIAARVG